MIWILVRKELLTNLLTLRLGIAVIFTVVLAVLTTFIGSLDYSRNVAAYQEEVREAEQDLNQVTVYGQLQPRVIAPPTAAVRAVSRRAGNLRPGNMGRDRPDIRVGSKFRQLRHLADENPGADRFRHRRRLVAQFSSGGSRI